MRDSGETGELDGDRKAGRKTIFGVGLLAAIAGLAWITMDAGRMRTLVMVVMAGFALRLLLSHRHSRYDKGSGPEV